MSAPVQVAVVVVNFNLVERLLACLRSVERHAGMPVELWVVDNGSTDESLVQVRAQFPNARILANRENLGFARANNQALERVETAYALLINNDAELTAGALPRLCELLDRDPGLALVGPKLIEPDGRIQISTGRMIHFHTESWQRLLGTALRHDWPVLGALVRRRAERAFEPHWVSGACCLLRVEAARRAGLFDPVFFMYTEEVDLCQRLRRLGYRIRFEPAAVAIHHGGGSSGRLGGRTALEYRRSQLYFYRKHHGRIGLELLRAYLIVKFTLAGWRAAGAAERAGALELLALVRGYPGDPARAGP